ncbi:MAG: hypothetical protein Q9216_006604, partial [Gyalolechia sp. 2 TL-2023]
MDRDAIYDLSGHLAPEKVDTDQRKTNAAIPDVIDKDQLPLEAASFDQGQDVHHMADFDAATLDEESEFHSNNEDGAYPGRTASLITKLAPELRNMILEWLWETAFHLGFVYPHIHTYYDSYECKEISPSAARPDFLLLSSGVMEEHEKRFWAENTIVIGPGSPSYSTDFLDKIPASDQIQKVDLTFTIHDLHENIVPPTTSAGSPTGITGVRATTTTTRNFSTTAMTRQQALTENTATVLKKNAILSVAKGTAMIPSKLTASVTLQSMSQVAGKAKASSITKTTALISPP